MPVADSIYFTKEHIEANKGKAPAPLAELAVHSLELVAELVELGLKFRFKGGNSLLVLLGEPRRFSIDVDISTDETRERIDEVVGQASEKYGVFTKWQRRQHKTKPWLPMTSYEIFFDSRFSEPEKSFIMLDAQLHNTLYPSTHKPVCCNELYKSDTVCELPDIASLLGDKLLTLGPFTLGIPLGKGKEAQRLKHIHDVSLLSSCQPKVENIREAVSMCMEQENQLQETKLQLGEVFEDTVSLCKVPSIYAKEPDEDQDDPVLGEILVGRIPFSEHLLSGTYPWQKLQVDGGRAALCFAAVVNTEITSEQLHNALKDPEALASQANAETDELATANPQAMAYWKTFQDWMGRSGL